MRIFAISDPHLSLGVEGKSMEKFGTQWANHHKKIATACAACVTEDDLLLLPGDISWALRIDDARVDLDWVASLPGTKVICRGNHDYWWQGITKVRNALPEGVHAVHSDAIAIPGPSGPIHLCGTRLWDVPGLSFADLVAWRTNGENISRAPRSKEEIARSEKLYRRELGRLDNALAAMNGLTGDPAARIALVHYPPTSSDLGDTDLTARFEAARIDHVVFGHLHSLKTDLPPLFGKKNGVRYHLTSCDYLDFQPLCISKLPS